MKRTALAAIFLLFLASLATAQESKDALQAYRAGKFEEAIAICADELAATPNRMDSYVVICWSLVRMARYGEADTWAGKGRQINRYDPRIIEISGEISYYLGRNQESLKFFQDYITLAPEGVRADVAYYFMGELYIRLAKYRHADIALSNAVRYVPTNALWWIRLGYAREQLADKRYALLAYEKALSLDPQSVDARRGIERTRS